MRNAHRPRHAVVLAAGQGSRLRPLTDDVPKPLLPIDGRPVIERVLDQLGAAGVHQVMVVVGYRAGLLRSHLEERARANSWPDLSFAVQEPRRGSAHALRCALDAGFPSTDAVVAGADTWWRDEDVLELTACFAEQQPMVAMGLRRWPIEQLPHRSVCRVDPALRLHAVVERPDPATLQRGSGLSGSPIYVFAADFWRYVQQIEDTGENILALSVALQRAIDAGGVVQGVEMRETRDLTRPADLLRHNFPYLDRWLPEQPTPG